MKDDQIEVIESDVEKMQRRPTMYIGNLGEMGALHLRRPIHQNRTLWGQVCRATR